MKIKEDWILGFFGFWLFLSIYGMMKNSGFLFVLAVMFLIMEGSVFCKLSQLVVSGI